MDEGRAALSLRMAQDHPAAAAAVLETETPEAAAAFLSDIPARTGGPVLARMLPFHAARCATAMNVDDAAGLLGEMPSAIAAGILRQCRDTRRDKLLAALPQRRSQAVARLIGYPQHTVGAAMQPQPAMLPEDIDVGTALARLRQEAEDLDSHVHVVDRDLHLRGRVRTAELLRAEPTTPITRLVEAVPEVLGSRDDLLSCRDLPAWEQHDLLPVVARDGRFVGVLHHAELMRGLITARAATAAQAGDRSLHLADHYWLGLARVVEGVMSLLPGQHDRPGPGERR